MPPLPKDTSCPIQKQHWYSRQYYKLAEKMEYWDKNDKPFVVPSGFVHDYASIPRIFWPVLTPYGPYGVAAIFHDCFHNDKLFYEMMIEGGTPKWLAAIMYAAVAHPPKNEDDITAGNSTQF